MNHINSYSRKSLGNKCPYDVFSFLYGQEILDLLGYHRIPPREVTLRERHGLRKRIHRGNAVESDPWNYWKASDTELPWDEQNHCFLSKDEFF